MNTNLPPEQSDPWAPPEPGTHFDLATPGEAPRMHRGRRPLVLAAALAAFALGATGVAAFSGGGSTAGSGTAATPIPSVSVPAPSSTVTIPPATTVPSPSTTSPSTAVPSTPGTTASTSSLAGVVNVDTVLGYQQAEAAGTGMVLTSTGEVLTNNHVVDGATKISVTVIATGTTYTASVVGTDPTQDVAVLKLLNASGLTTAPFGSSAAVKVGDPVVGVGNAGGTGTPTSAPGAVVDLGQTITATDETGANAETLHDLIQISANLQPGESGGPLYSAGGMVIGMDSAGSATSGRFRLQSASSTGYAIPIDDALAVAKQIEAGKPTATITIGTPPMLGIAVSPTASSTGGVTVLGVSAGTPAAKAGLQAGDVITAVGSTKVSTNSDLTAALTAHKAGDSVKITWTTNGVTHSATAVLIAGPAN